MLGMGGYMRKKAIRASYEEACRLGSDSPIEVIRKSAQVPGWLFKGEPEILYEMATKAPPGNFLEIGSLFGKSTSILAGVAKERNKGECVFAIDTFTLDGSDNDMNVHRVTHGQTCSFPVFLERAKALGYYEQVVPIAAFSTRALPQMDLKLSFAFIDGCHDESAVADDLKVVFPKLVPGAIMLFHDAIGEHYPGVLGAINKFSHSRGRLEQIGSAGTIMAYKFVAS
jgi:predicted O-methyltransferase YrrM